MTIVSSTLDSFNRPDSDNLGENWSVQASGDELGPRLAIESNSAVCPPLAGPLMEWWNPSVFGPDVQLLLDVSGVSGFVKLYVRIPSPHPGVPPDEWGALGVPWDMVAQGGYSSEFLLGAGPAKSAVSLTAEGSTITSAYRIAATGEWIIEGSDTDITYPDAGYVGIELTDGFAATGATIGEGDDVAIPAGPIDIGRRLLTVASASGMAIDLNTPLYR